MLKIRKPPENVLAVAAWFLAGLLFALISGIAFYEARAADATGLDDGHTIQENCTDACNREHSICVDSSGSGFDSNYGDENAFAGLKANCDRDAGKCIQKCGIVSPTRKDPSNGATGN